MEVAPGVFLSKAPVKEWEPDPDTPGQVHVLSSGAGMEAGLWRWVPGVTPEPFRWTLPGREVILVLEGTATIDM